MPAYYYGVPRIGRSFRLWPWPNSSNFLRLPVGYLWSSWLTLNKVAVRWEFAFMYVPLQTWWFNHPFFSLTDIPEIPLLQKGSQWTSLLHSSPAYNGPAGLHEGSTSPLAPHNRNIRTRPYREGQTDQYYRFKTILWQPYFQNKWFFLRSEEESYHTCVAAGTCSVLSLLINYFLRYYYKYDYSNGNYWSTGTRTSWTVVSVEFKS